MDGGRKAWASLELELQTVVSCHVVLATRAASVPNCRVNPPAQTNALPYLLKICLSLFMCPSVSSFAPCASSALRDQPEGTGSSGNGVTGNCEPTDMGPLHEQ